MSYDDWKTSALDCDEEPCWRCKSAQKDVGNYCGDCAKGETMAELDNVLGAINGDESWDHVRVGRDEFRDLIAAARELAEWRTRALLLGEALADWQSTEPPSCRACGAELTPECAWVADGCPCNSPRGINHGIVARRTCTCVLCDPEQTGSTRAPEKAER